MPVRVRGLSQHGYLEAEDLEGGGRYELHPDGNRWALVLLWSSHMRQ